MYDKLFNKRNLLNVVGDLESKDDYDRLVNVINHNNKKYKSLRINRQDVIDVVRPLAKREGHEPDKMAASTLKLFQIVINGQDQIDLETYRTYLKIVTKINEDVATVAICRCAWEDGQEIGVDENGNMIVDVGLAKIIFSDTDIEIIGPNE
ncbi:MAG: hypothetical protein D4S01_11475 [Dehalococcoidia bacterium]|nr:MAG: hypothetical protein D4S01_11475 [Dehalococcoidia bacterium]